MPALGYWVIRVHFDGSVNQFFPPLHDARELAYPVGSSLSQGAEYSLRRIHSITFLWGIGESASIRKNSPQIDWDVLQT